MSALGAKSQGSVIATDTLFPDLVRAIADDGIEATINISHLRVSIKEQ